MDEAGGTPRFDPLRDYPLGERRPDLVRTAMGLALGELTLDGLRDGAFTAEELRATPQTMRLQAQVARAAGREPLANDDSVQLSHAVHIALGDTVALVCSIAVGETLALAIPDANIVAAPLRVSERDNLRRLQGRGLCGRRGHLSAAE